MRNTPPHKEHREGIRASDLDACKGREFKVKRAMYNRAELRTRVDELLKKTNDLKVLRCEQDQVIQSAEEAVKLAKQLGTPWYQIASYRLAQLLFRRETNFVEDLERIDKLFEVACKASKKFMGLLPLVYRLAVLARLSDLKTEEEREKYRKLMSAVYDEAIDVLQFPSTAHPDRDKVPLQPIEFNLLEFASFALGLRYDRLLGTGTPLDSGRFDYSGEWQLLCGDSRSRRIRYAYPVAFAEVEEIGQQETDALLFVLGANKSQWRLGKQTWVAAPEGTLRYVAILLSNPGSAPEGPPDSDDPKGYVRQTKSRAKKELRKLLGKRNLDPFGDHRVTLPVPVYGIVQSNMLRFS